MSSNEINVISNNINGIQSTLKKLKVIECLKSKLLPWGILFLQDTCSTESNYESCTKDFNAALFFSCRLSNSCGVLFSILGKYDVKVLNQMPDNKALSWFQM